MSQYPWKQTIVALDGTKEYPGAADNPIIMGWRDAISSRYPKFRDYLNSVYTHDSVAWCGFLMGYAMAVNGIEPPKEFLWARNWLKWGEPTSPRDGAVLVFERGEGGHVAIYDGEDANYYYIWGGNQTNDSVNRGRYPKNKLLGARWPSVQAAIAPTVSSADIAGVGRSTSKNMVNKLVDVPKTLGVANIRYNNPGAQYPSEMITRFGMDGYGIIGGNHKIARFPHFINGAAANFATLKSGYVGMKIGDAGKKWTGNYGSGIPGYNDETILTARMVEDPGVAIPMMQSIARREAGAKALPWTDAQWRAAHEMFMLGSADAWLLKYNAIDTATKPGEDMTTVTTVPTPIAIPQQPSVISVLWNVLRGKPVVPPPNPQGVARPGLSPDGDPALYDLQKQLADKGYTMVGKPDGEMGPNTEDAILAFRREHGMPLTVELGQDFMAALAASGPRQVAASRANTTANDLRAQNNTVVGQFDLFKKIGVLSAFLGLGGTALDPQDINNFNDTLSQLGSVVQSIGSLLKLILNVVQWILAHQNIVLIVLGIYLIYRGALGVGRLVQVFRSGVFTRADV